MCVWPWPFGCPRWRTLVMDMCCPEKEKRRVAGGCVGESPERMTHPAALIPATISYSRR